MKKITPFLWFDGKTEEAMNFYTSIFKNSKVLNFAKLGGNMATATIELEGNQFMMLDGGPMFKFTPAISFFVSCDTQDDVDYYWSALSEGGEIQQCGWLVDKYGVSWQIIPKALGELMYDKDPEKSQRVMQAMLKMKKIEVKLLEEAYKG